MSTTPRIYVAVSANHGPRSYDGPVSVIGAYSHPAIAKRACQHDAQHGHAATVPPIKWLGGEDAGTYWTDAEPYGYQIVRTGLDSHAGPGPLRCESCGEHMADPHAPDCPEDIGAEIDGRASNGTRDQYGTCANCGESIHTHRPAHHDGSGPCWIHDDGGMHGCGEAFGSDAVAEPAAEVNPCGVPEADTGR